LLGPRYPGEPASQCCEALGNFNIGSGAETVSRRVLSALSVSIQNSPAAISLHNVLRLLQDKNVSTSPCHNLTSIATNSSAANCSGSSQELPWYSTYGLDAESASLLVESVRVKLVPLAAVHPGGVSVDYQSGNVSFVVANGTVPRDLKGTTVLLVNVSTVIDGFVSNDSFPSVVSAIAQDIEAYVATREHPYTSAKYQRLSAFDHQVRGSMAEVEQDINLEIGVAVDNYGLNLSTPAGFGVVQLSQDDVAQMVRAMAAFLRPEPGNHSSLNLSTEVINHSLVNITYQEGILQRTDCDDDPPDWESVAGAELYPCYTYTDISPPLCTEDGEHGLGWDSDGDGIMDFGWGRIETHGIDTAGISAFDACCLCGGGKDFNVSGAKVHYVISTDLEVSESVAGPAFAEGLASAVNDAKREGGNVSTSRPRDIIRLSADFVTRLNFTLEITVDTVAGEIVAELVQQLLDLALTNASLVQHIRTAGGHASSISVLDVSTMMAYKPIEPGDQPMQSGVSGAVRFVKSGSEATAFACQVCCRI
jgi:hypothetical protein